MPGNHANWQHNPAWRGNIPYPNNNIAQHYHQTNVPGGLSVTHNAVQQQHREAVKSQIQHPTAQQQQRREQLRTATPAQRQQKLNDLHANALSGNDIRSPSWQSQQARGLQSRHISGLSSEQRSAAREQLSEHHELRRR